MSTFALIGAHARSNSPSVSNSGQATRAPVTAYCLSCSGFGFGFFGVILPTVLVKRSQASGSVSTAIACFNFRRFGFVMSLVPPDKKVRGNRGRGYLDNRHLRALATEVGLLTYAWNQLHVNFTMALQSLIFGAQHLDESSLHHHEITKAIWYSIKSDTGQRDLLRATSKVALRSEPHILKEILWLLDETDRLASSRNAAMHVAVDIYGVPDSEGETTVCADDVFGPPRAARLKGKNLVNMFKAASEHALALSDFCDGLLFLVYGWTEQPRSWPERPSLPEILRDQSTRQSSQKSTGTKPPHQPRSEKR